MHNKIFLRRGGWRYKVSEESALSLSIIFIHHPAQMASQREFPFVLWKLGVLPFEAVALPWNAITIFYAFLIGNLHPYLT